MKEKTNCSSTRTYLFSFYLFFISTINSPCFRPPEIKNFQFYSPLNNFLPPPLFFDVITAEFYAPLLGTFISFSFSHSLRRSSLSLFLSLSLAPYICIWRIFIYIYKDRFMYICLFLFISRWLGTEKSIREKELLDINLKAAF